MGIYEQPNSWQCGPFALKHGLLAYGVFAHEDALAAAAGSSEQHGTDELQLARVAQAHGCRLLVERRYTARAARRTLRRYLAERVPVLLCVDQWDHWVVAVGCDDTHLVVLDSHYETVIRLEPWETYLRRLPYRERRFRWAPALHLYDLHPLVARGEPALRLALTPARARRLLDGAPAIRRGLDGYAGQLAAHAAPSRLAAGAVPLAAWIELHQARLAERVVDEVLEGWRTAADLFGIRVLPAALPEVVALLEGESRRAPAVAVTGRAAAALPVAS